jgi:ElaB/YqjD/DUF883 family membrane-anchored ribosome-binding protein
MPAGQRKAAPTIEGAGNDDSAESSVSGLAQEAMDRIEDAAEAMADRGGEAMAGAGETLRRVGQATTDFTGEMAGRARTAGARAAHRIESEFGERPWTVTLAAAAVAAVLGFLIGSRRHTRY